MNIFDMKQLLHSVLFLYIHSLSMHSHSCSNALVPFSCPFVSVRSFFFNPSQETGVPIRQLTKDDHIATRFLDGVLPTDGASARVIMLNREDLDQVGVLELCNRLLSSRRRLRVRRQRRLTRVLLVGAKSLCKSSSLAMLLILVVTERVD